MPAIAGHLFFRLPRPGTWQLGEVGFLLHTGEFVPAARSQAVAYPRGAVAAHHSQTALLVTPRGSREAIGNLWDQEAILHERRKPKLRGPLRIATFALEAQAAGQEGEMARLVSELAAGKSTRGHEVHVFVPAGGDFRGDEQVGGVHYHALTLERGGSPLEQRAAFARAAERRFRELPPFDLLHFHEWMAGPAGWTNGSPTVLSLSSIETVRRNGTPLCPLSLAIEHAERTAARAAGLVLTPEWLREPAVRQLGLDAGRVRILPMQARLANEWEVPLDPGQVKKEIGLGPFDRLMLFVGPLEHAAGVDLLIEVLPVMLHRTGALRLVYAGAGSMHPHLEQRAPQLGVAHAVRLLGHVEKPALTRLLRAAEALVLPARCRVPWDDGVVELARLAGRPVVTTHGGPAHLVQHGQTGLITYDNPGSMVWALDQIVHDPARAEQMGRNGRRDGDRTPIGWVEVARRYLDLCAEGFPELCRNDW
jgi:glycosyltransferase involved in cell wall biosynthesis